VAGAASSDSASGEVSYALPEPASRLGEGPRARERERLLSAAAAAAVLPLPLPLPLPAFFLGGMMGGTGLFNERERKEGKEKVTG
jgi:hypothetical protein